MTKEQEFERSVEREFRKAFVAYVKEPIVGKTQPDFLVTTPAGDQIVIEVKAWPRSQASARAAHQARRYAQLSKAAGAFVITTPKVFASRRPMEEKRTGNPAEGL